MIENEKLMDEMDALAAEVEAHEEDTEFCFFGYDYSAEAEMEELCTLARERYPQTPDPDAIEQVPPEGIRKRICLVAVCPEMPGIVGYFLVAGIRAGTAADIVFCAVGRP